MLRPYVPWLDRFHPLWVLVATCMDDSEPPFTVIPSRSEESNAYAFVSMVRPGFLAAARNDSEVQELLEGL